MISYEEKTMQEKTLASLISKFARLKEKNNTKIRKLFSHNDINLLTKTVKV